MTVTRVPTCRVGQWQGNDCFHDQFFPAMSRRTSGATSGACAILGLDTYDKPGDGSDAGALSTEQLGGSVPSSPGTGTSRRWCSVTILCRRDSPFPITPSNTLDAIQAATILGDYAGTPACSSTTPGTLTATSAQSARSPPGHAQEIAAGKEYPGGFSLLRLYTGGYALNFYKTRSRLARAWSERSRQEIVGLWPQFALGSSVTDRNTVVAHDLSGLRPVRHRHHRSHHQHT